MSDWQGIATAPEDHFVLLYEPEIHKVCLAYWSQPTSEPPGWYGVDECGLTVNTAATRLSPTHWQPLPPPPETPR